MRHLCEQFPMTGDGVNSDRGQTWTKFKLLKAESLFIQTTHINILWIIFKGTLTAVVKRIVKKGLC